MNYSDLNNCEKVHMYVPAMKRFYRMRVTHITHSGLNEFNISNWGATRFQKIGGHEVMFTLRSQNDVDHFFYITPRQPKHEDFLKAEKQFQKNGREWIFHKKPATIKQIPIH